MNALYKDGFMGDYEFELISGYIKDQREDVYEEEKEAQKETVR